jgi:hypothetical protein
MAAPGTVPAFQAPPGQAEVVQKMDMEAEIVPGEVDVRGISRSAQVVVPVAVQ